MLLSHSQAEAVYAAMCHMNNVSARVHVRFDYPAIKGRVLHVIQYENHAVSVFVGDMVGNCLSDSLFETYRSQEAFASAYTESAGSYDPII